MAPVEPEEPAERPLLADPEVVPDADVAADASEIVGAGDVLRVAAGHGHRSDTDLIVSETHRSDPGRRVEALGGHEVPVGVERVERGRERRVERRAGRGIEGAAGGARVGERAAEHEARAQRAADGDEHREARARQRGLGRLSLDLQLRARGRVPEGHRQIEPVVPEVVGPRRRRRRRGLRRVVVPGRRCTIGDVPGRGLRPVGDVPRRELLLGRWKVGIGGDGRRGLSRRRGLPGRQRGRLLRRRRLRRGLRRRRGLSRRRGLPGRQGRQRLLGARGGSDGQDESGDDRR
jgi:hypothetical protein